jgi:hypothetical protein
MWSLEGRDRKVKGGYGEKGRGWRRVMKSGHEQGALHAHVWERHNEALFVNKKKKQCTVEIRAYFYNVCNFTL